MTWDLRRGLLAVFLLAAAAASWWFSHSVTESQPSLAAGENRDPDYYIENFRATVMNTQGQRKYTLTAEIMKHYPHNETVRLDKPHLIRYKAGRGPIHTRADLGWLNNDNKEIVMTGNVKITHTGDASSQSSEISTSQIRILLD